MLLALSDVTYVLIGWFKFLLLKFLYEYGPWCLCGRRRSGNRLAGHRRWWASWTRQNTGTWTLIEGCIQLISDMWLALLVVVCPVRGHEFNSKLAEKFVKWFSHKMNSIGICSLSLAQLEKLPVSVTVIRMFFPWYC